MIIVDVYLKEILCVFVMLSSIIVKIPSLAELTLRGYTLPHPFYMCGTNDQHQKVHLAQNIGGLYVITSTMIIMISKYK